MSGNLGCKSCGTEWGALVTNLMCLSRLPQPPASLSLVAHHPTSTFVVEMPRGRHGIWLPKQPPRGQMMQLKNAVVSGLCRHYSTRASSSHSSHSGSRARICNTASSSAKTREGSWSNSHLSYSLSSLPISKIYCSDLQQNKQARKLVKTQYGLSAPNGNSNDSKVWDLYYIHGY